MKRGEYLHKDIPGIGQDVPDYELENMFLLPVDYSKILVNKIKSRRFPWGVMDRE